MGTALLDEKVKTLTFCAKEHPDWSAAEIGRVCGVHIRTAQRVLKKNEQARSYERMLNVVRNNKGHYSRVVEYENMAKLNTWENGHALSHDAYCIFKQLYSLPAEFVNLAIFYDGAQPKKKKFRNCAKRCHTEYTFESLLPIVEEDRESFFAANKQINKRYPDYIVFGVASYKDKKPNRYLAFDPERNIVLVYMKRKARPIFVAFDFVEFIKKLY